MRAEIKSSVDETITDLNTVEGTVTQIERKPQMFPHISDTELKRRKQFVRESREKLRKIKTALSSSKTQGKLDADRRQALTARRNEGMGGAAGPAGGAHSGAGLGGTRRHGDVIRSQQQEQMVGRWSGRSVRVGCLASEQAM